MSKSHWVDPIFVQMLLDSFSYNKLDICGVTLIANKEMHSKVSNFCWVENGQCPNFVGGNQFSAGKM